MWRWTALVYLLIFYGHITSQPVSDETENARRARQLDFVECCPCPGPGAEQIQQPVFREQEFASSNGEGMISRARDVDDCPCRLRQPDSEGASSVFFPTSMRTDGAVVRPSDKKEDVKPLLHPEVDLASSVLQTLREATDEEYKDALARDAARSIAKAAEETVFGDSTPEASRNVVTIIVNPKHIDSEDDVIPQESNIQNARSNLDLGKLRYPPKQPSLLRDIFGQPGKPVGLLNRNLLDMDNGMRASNIEEHVVPVDDYENETKDKQSLRTSTPLLKLGSNLKSKLLTAKSSSNIDGDGNKGLKWPFLQNRPLKDLIPTRTSLEGEENTRNSSPLIPKIKLNKSFSKTRDKINDDLNLLPSTIQEKTAGKLPYFKPKSHLENILDKTGPLNLKTLLKLKDVELLPFKDIVSKSTERPKFTKPTLGLPDIFNRGQNLIRKDNNDIQELKNRDDIETSLTSSQVIEPEVSPSEVIEQISDTNCDNGANSKDVDGQSLNQNHDLVPNSSNIQPFSNVDDKKLVDSLSNELTDTTDCEIAPFTETNVSQSAERSLDEEIQITDKDNLIPKEIDSSCVDDNNFDPMTDSSNNDNVIIENENSKPSLVNENTDPTEETNNQDQKAGHNLNYQNAETKRIDPFSLHKTLSSIKENIINKLEKFKNPKSISKNSEVFEQQRSSSNVIENKVLPSTIKDDVDTDCQNEDLSQVTTMEPKTYALENAKESSKEISMQDLQKISDSMLQQEEENRESGTLKCNNSSSEVDEPSIHTSRKTGIVDLENIADSENTSDPENVSDSQNLNVPEKVADSENNSGSENSPDFGYFTDSGNAANSEIITNSENHSDPENHTDSENASVSENIADSQNAADSQNEIVVEQPNLVEHSDKNEKNICKSDLSFTKQMLPQETDANVEASEIIINKIPHSRDNIGTTFEVVQPKEDDIDILRNPLPNIGDIFKLPPLPTLEDMESRLTDLFDKSAGNVKELLSSDETSMTKSDVLSSTMTTDASTADFQSRPFRLKDVNFDLLPNIPKIGKAKLTLPKVLKPLKFRSALENKGNILGTTLAAGRPRIPKLDDLKKITKTNTDKLFSNPLKSDYLRNSFIPNQDLSDISENLHNHAKNTWKNMERTLQSKFKEITKVPTNLQSNDLLEVISQNHEDVNDKLRALHIDLNDRIDTMRNSLADKSVFLTTESRKGKGNLKSFDGFGKPKSRIPQPKSKKITTPRRKIQHRPIGKGSNTLTNQKPFRMPTAASVPVPKTIEVPLLKSTPMKSPGLTIQRKPNILSNIRNIEVPQKELSSVPLWKQPTQKHIGSRINPFKDSKIQVSFSTTPLPPIVPRQQSRKLITTPSSYLQKTGSAQRFMSRGDSNGSPSEMKNSMTSPPNSPLTGNRSEQPDRQYNDRLSPRYKESEIARSENTEVVEHRRNSNLKSWPKVSESAFLSKVKEAMKARLPKVDSASKVKQFNVHPTIEKQTFLENDALPTMTQSASENIDVTALQPLKENVQFKCKMVCTQE